MTKPKRLSAQPGEDVIIASWENPTENHRGTELKYKKVSKWAILCFFIDTDEMLDAYFYSELFLVWIRTILFSSDPLIHVRHFISCLIFLFHWEP